MKITTDTQLHQLMQYLNISDTELSAHSGVDRTLISRWRRGEREISRRSTQLMPIVHALLEMDEGGRRLKDYLGPQRRQGETYEKALVNCLTGEAYLAPPADAELPSVAEDGEYIKQVHVFLGQRGFRKATLGMLDYVQQLPLAREVRVLCPEGYDWLAGDMVFVMQFIARLRKCMQRGARLLVITRGGYSITQTAAFAGPWLLAHLYGYIRSRYYDGGMPHNVRFLASIQGYWSGRAEERSGAEDGLYVQTQTDPFDIERDEHIIETCLAASRPASQYGFLANPMGGKGNARLWREGPLPAWEDTGEGELPDGSFYALCRVPGFGIMTAQELDQARGRTPAPPMPGYLFAASGWLAPGEHRIIFCREDIREGLSGESRVHRPLSALLGRETVTPREMLCAQIERLLGQMALRDDFQVALMPRVAFEKLQLELVCFRGSVSIGWLQDMQNSVFADERATSGSFYGFLGYVWDKMLAGWKRPEKVARQLRRWMDGKDLEACGPDSAMVRNWDAML